MMFFRCLIVVLAVAPIGGFLLHPASAEGQEIPGRGVFLPEREFMEGLEEDDLPRPGSPWLRIEAGASDDNQPMTGFSAALEGGFRLLPWLTLDLEAGWRELDDAVRRERMISARTVAGARWERVGLEGAIWGGGFQRSGVERGDWSGGTGLRIRGMEGLVLEAGTERDVYLGTPASLQDSLTFTRIRGAVGRQSRAGWAARLSYSELRFPDENRIEDGRLWVLAPLLRTGRGGLRMGYALRTSDSDESAYAPVEPFAWNEQGWLEGRYAGAYTPAEILSHSLLVQLWYEVERVRARLDGSWGLRAEEDRPILFPAVPGAPESGIDLQFQRRRYVPWSVGTRIEVPIRPGWELQAEGGYGKNAFHEGAFLALGWVMSSPE